MNIIKVNYFNRRAGVFVAIPSEAELPNTLTSFALVQICRVSENGFVVHDPANTQNWDGDPESTIKQATLDLHTGWFIDNLSQEPIQENCMYYMDSFSLADQEAQLQFVTHDGNHDGGELHENDAAAQPISAANFSEQYTPHTVAVGAESGQYPMLRDSPQQPVGTRLDFQVHLVYINTINTNTAVVISKGFRWTYRADQDSTFDGFVPAPSNEFTKCMQAVLKFQNDISGTNWVLLIDH